MKNELLLITTILFLLLCFSGCLGPEGAKVENPFEGITFKSNVVELVNASLVLYKDKNIIIKSDVKYLFRNIAGRTVDVKVIVEFYDINNNLLDTIGPKYISIPKDYTETVYSPANIISYKGEKVTEVHHARIIAEE